MEISLKYILHSRLKLEWDQDELNRRKQLEAKVHITLFSLNLAHKSTQQKKRV